MSELGTGLNSVMCIYLFIFYLTYCRKIEIEGSGIGSCIVNCTVLM